MASCWILQRRRAFNRNHRLLSAMRKGRGRSWRQSQNVLGSWFLVLGSWCLVLGAWSKKQVLGAALRGAWCLVEKAGAWWNRQLPACGSLFTTPYLDSPMFETCDLRKLFSDLYLSRAAKSLLPRFGGVRWPTGRMRGAFASGNNQKRPPLPGPLPQFFAAKLPCSTTLHPQKFEGEGATWRCPAIYYSSLPQIP